MSLGWEVHNFICYELNESLRIPVIDYRRDFYKVNKFQQWKMNEFKIWNT